VKIDDRQKFLAIAAASAVALLAGDRLVLTPLIGLWHDHTVRLAELHDSITRGTSLLPREQAIRDRWAKLQKSTLPQDGSAAESKVLTAVDDWARNSGVGPISIRPQWKQSDNYKTLECRVDATGDLDTLVRFLEAMEHDPMALRVEDLEISARDDGGQQLSLAVRFTALVLTGEQG
jgi:hypothetical protein